MSCSAHKSGGLPKKKTALVFDALVYRMPPASPPVAQAISIDAYRPLQTPAGIESPAVMIFREQDIRNMEDACEIGRQHAGKELASILINRKGIAGKDKLYILLCKYRSVGTLNNAIRKFLERVKASAENKIYLLCVDENLFNELAWQPAVEKAMLPMGPGRQPASQIPPPAAEHLCKEEMLAKNILELMERDKETLDDQCIRSKYRGNAYSCRLVRQRILTAARSDETVLIQGERGTGKEEVARAIHHHGALKAERFVAINCSAISPLLLEAELFGLEKDYPNKGTPKKEGLWSLAHNGTLFLDEIGELAPDHQSKILRAIQEKVIFPVGANEAKTVNARIIAATNRNLEARDKYGKHHFRQDLHDRLKQIVIRTPRLKDHPGDIPEYALSIWKELTKDANATLDAALIDLLMNQPWEDNVRGLRNILNDLHKSFPNNQTVEKLEYLMQYRKTVVQGVISPETLVTAELSEMIEVLAKASHATWYKKRQEEGWVWGPQRMETEQAKTNPDMKAYRELSETQKSYAREEARAILRALLDQGYAIVK